MKKIKIKREAGLALLLVTLAVGFCLLLSTLRPGEVRVTRGTAYVDSVELITPLTVIDEINAPEYRVHWSNGAVTRSRRRLSPGDSVAVLYYR